jgi:H+-translocating NAD(P) transhydrogenase subunit alpha
VDNQDDASRWDGTDKSYKSYKSYESHGSSFCHHEFMPAETLIATFYVLILAAFLGYQVISRVPSLLHTPLMSATNAISGISLVGSLVTAGAHHTIVSAVLGFLAVTCSSINVVGGFVITDRMLKMFRKRETPVAKKED